MALVLAVDGGNSKTDVALLSGSGELLSWVRGPGSAIGALRAARLIGRLAGAAARAAGLDLASAHAACYLAGADLPWQVEERRATLDALGVFASVSVGNDAWALLRLGAPAGAPAVGVVCGAGLKCVARTGGDRYEFPSLGWQTGDLSGAGDFLAREAVRVAARAEDGRGPDTPLREGGRRRAAPPGRGGPPPPVRPVRTCGGRAPAHRRTDRGPPGRARPGGARPGAGGRSGGGLGRGRAGRRGRRDGPRGPPAPRRRPGLDAGPGRRPVRRPGRPVPHRGPHVGAGPGGGVHPGRRGRAPGGRRRTARPGPHRRRGLLPGRRPGLPRREPVPGLLGPVSKSRCPTARRSPRTGLETA